VPRIYELCADEAWTHGSVPRLRYWCFFGGIFGAEADLWRLEVALQKIIHEKRHRIEIKWSNVSPVTVPIYELLIDEFFEHLRTREIRYRQIFLDRKYVYVPEKSGNRLSDLDVQYRVYYQFLKHHFGLQYLPRAEGTFDTVFFRLDRHSSQQHTEELKAFAEKLPSFLGRTDLDFQVSFVDSKKHLRLQICDVLMGAAGSYGNKMHLQRQPGQRGKTEKQKCREAIAKRIYEQLKSIDAAQRGTKAFNWFESTGMDSSPESKLNHKIRIWKFVPSRYQIDKGWENDHLDKFGRYIGPDLGPIIEG
jgi:hypothetical protein